MLVFGYRIYNGSVQIASSSTANYILNGATNYTFSVKAFDAAGNISNGSNNLAIKLWHAYYSYYICCIHQRNSLIQVLTLVKELKSLELLERI
jgi:hypothetical protein